jgi:hypothetical protein
VKSCILILHKQKDVNNSGSFLVKPTEVVGQYAYHDKLCQQIIMPSSRELEIPPTTGSSSREPETHP